MESHQFSSKMVVPLVAPGHWNAWSSSERSCQARLGAEQPQLGFRESDPLRARMLQGGRIGLNQVLEIPPGNSIGRSGLLGVFGILGVLCGCVLSRRFHLCGRFVA